MISPVSGNLFKWFVSDGQMVAAGDMLAIMEAMKMEVQVIAHRQGSLKQVIAEGNYVNAGLYASRN